MEEDVHVDERYEQEEEDDGSLASPVQHTLSHRHPLSAQVENAVGVLSDSPPSEEKEKDENKEEKNEDDDALEEVNEKVDILEEVDTLKEVNEKVDALEEVNEEDDDASEEENEVAYALKEVLYLPLSLGEGACAPAVGNDHHFCYFGSSGSKTVADPSHDHDESYHGHAGDEVHVPNPSSPGCVHSLASFQHQLVEHCSHQGKMLVQNKVVLCYKCHKH